jgi:hypothetical protein
MAAKSKARQKQSRSAGGFWATETGKKTFVVLLGLIGLAGLIVIIIGFPTHPGAKYGVGADGFSVFEMQGTDLGIAEVVSKATVQEELGSLVKQVDDVEKTSVLNYDGNKGQTATYYIITKGGASGSFYVDLMQFQSQQAYDNAHVFNGTLDAGNINGMPAHYMQAATIANEREYALLVSKGAKSYKFAITQPFHNIEIDEVTAQAALKRIAAKAHL